MLKKLFQKTSEEMTEVERFRAVVQRFYKLGFRYNPEQTSYLRDFYNCNCDSEDSQCLFTDTRPIPGTNKEEFAILKWKGERLRILPDSTILFYEQNLIDGRSQFLREESERVNVREMTVAEFLEQTRKVSRLSPDTKISNDIKDLSIK